MLSLNITDLILHRKILDWRDKHMELIEYHFSQELPKLIDRMNNEIDFLSKSSDMTFNNLEKKINNQTQKFCCLYKV